MRSLIRLLQATATHPLNRRSAGSVLAALSRVLRWQFASRLLREGAFALPFVNGSSLVVTRGMVGATGNWYAGLDEPEEMGFLLHVLQPGDRFIDIGANIGSFSILAASLPGVQVVAFEPVPATFGELKRNVAFNQFFDRVEVRQQGVSDAPGSLSFTADLKSMNYAVRGASVIPDKTIEVEAVTLDDAIPPAPSQPTMFKIDVEGFEMSVLQGGARTFAAANALCVVMETNGSGQRYGVPDSALFACMKDYGFEPYRYNPFTRQLTPVEEGASGHINTIFVKDPEETARRLRGARPSALVNGTI